MAQLITLPNVTDDRGKMTIIDRIFPFEIKRSFYIYNVSKDSIRGAHRHKKTWQALICVSGSCLVKCNNGKERKDYLLNAPDKCLILAPQDWHTMENFSEDAILLVYASEFYDANDYIDEDYS